MSVRRRVFLQGAVSVTLGFAGLRSLMASGGRDLVHRVAPGFGPLVPDPAGLMDLPRGFSYRVLSRTGDPMSDGLPTPGAPDGMAAFPGPEGRVIVVRNHELDVEQVATGPFGADLSLLHRVQADRVFDRGRGVRPCLGGTTTLVLAPGADGTLGIERSFLSLAGTSRNCAGGPTPRNSWISCEETTQRADATFEKDHGYNFEVPALATGPVEPIPLRAMGRFNHEAIAEDPATGIVYQTEDRPDGLIYRLLPNEPGRLEKGGRLQALGVRGNSGIDARNWCEGGAERAFERATPVETAWIDLDDVESPEDDLRYRGVARGAALFARGEGMWLGDGAIYFACTNGGPARKGQIWRYLPSRSEGRPGEVESPGRLELFVEAEEGGLVDNADNLTFSPWGDLVVCEDGSGEQFLVGVTPDGSLYHLGRNARGGGELAGACFSPDGRTLFVNMQADGVTLAIRGPWDLAPKVVG